MAIAPAELGWVAGVLDLKGRVVRKNNVRRATPQLVLIVESMQHNVVRELAALTGTQPEVQKTQSAQHLFARRGCTEHCPDQHIHVEIDNIKPVMRWTITGAAMAILLWNLQPYLRNGSELLKAMQEANDNMTLDGRGAAATVGALRRLERMGWSIPAQILRRMEEFDARDSAASVDGVQSE